MSSSLREEVVADDLLGLAIEFASTKHFQEAIDHFIDNNINTFQAIAECKIPESSELPHEYNVIFMDYQQLIDDLFEELAHKERFSTKQLYNCFRDAGMFRHQCFLFHHLSYSFWMGNFTADGKFTALFEENENKWFVDKVLSWMDFHEFLHMMQCAASRRGRK